MGTGTSLDFIGKDAVLMARETVMLMGEGGYEGLVAYLAADHLADQPLEAVIVGVEVPPMPELPAE